MSDIERLYVYCDIVEAQIVSGFWRIRVHQVGDGKWYQASAMMPEIAATMLCEQMYLRKPRVEGQS